MYGFNDSNLMNDKFIINETLHTRMSWKVSEFTFEKQN